MGRILRYALTEDRVTAIDLGFPTPGKLLIHPVTQDVRVAYDRADASSTTGVNYFTLFAGTQYIFDLSQGVGWLSQQQQMFLNSPDGDTVVEIWFANER